MPVRHPDPFRTSVPRLNPGVNPYIKLLETASTTGSLPIAYGEELRHFKGHWKERIAKYHYGTLHHTFEDLVVEVGCHKGRTLLEMAQKHPNKAFVGIDITFKRVYTTAQRAQRQGLKNVFIILANAHGIHELFAPAEISSAIIFFPDPWANKKRQEKHRLLQTLFLERLQSCLAPSGYFWFKTDQKNYFDAVTEIMKSLHFQELSQEHTCFKDQIYTTSFEEFFTKQHLPTFSCIWLNSLDKNRNIDALP